jgi:DNA-binding HxlR family transcriptional regulator
MVGVLRCLFQSNSCADRTRTRCDILSIPQGGISESTFGRKLRLAGKWATSESFQDDTLSSGEPRDSLRSRSPVRKYSLRNASNLGKVARVSGKPRSKHRSGCPVSISLEILGDRWSLLIIRDLMVRGFRTFREFQRSGEGIATNILANRLRKLETSGIITSEKGVDDKRKVNYRLTEKGIDLAPVLLELLIWGARHEETGTPCAVIETMAKIRQEILAEVRRRWQERDSTPLQVDGQWQLP